MTRPTPVPLLIPVLSASNFVIGMGAFVVIGLLEPIAADLAVSPARAGWVMTSYALAYAVLSPLLVSATGRLGRRRVLAAGFVLFALAHAAAALSPGEGALYAARVAAAAGAGMFTPVAATVVAALSAPERRARSLAAVFLGLTVAQVVGVPAGSFIAYTFGWRAAFAIVALLALPCIVMIWRTVPRGLSFQPVSLTDLRRMLVNGPVMLAVMFTTTLLGAIYIVYTYLGPLLSQTMGYGRDGITLALLMFGCGAVAGNLLGGMIADRIGPCRTLLIMALAQAGIMPFFSALPMPGAMLMGLIALWSAAGWSFMAGQQVRLMTLAPESGGVVLALNAAAIYVGAALGSAAGGAVLSGLGPAALGAAGGLAALLAVLNIIASQRVSPSR